MAEGRAGRCRPRGAGGLGALSCVQPEPAVPAVRSQGLPSVPLLADTRCPVLPTAFREARVCGWGQHPGLLGCTKHGMVTRTALVRAAGASQLPFHGSSSYPKPSRANPTVPACAHFSQLWLPISLLCAHHSSHRAEPGGRWASPMPRDTSAGLVSAADLLWHVTADFPATARTQPSTYGSAVSKGFKCRHHPSLSPVAGRLSGFVFQVHGENTFGSRAGEQHPRPTWKAQETSLAAVLSQASPLHHGRDGRELLHTKPSPALCHQGKDNWMGILIIYYITVSY